MIVDVNVSLSRWPFRRLRGDETPELVSMLRERGVSQAWAGSFDALLHKDIAGVNERLAAECRRSEGLLVPFGAVNPKLPDWEEDLRRCAEVHAMPGVRLHPDYHGYALDDPEFVRLLALAAGRRLLVQLALRVEDERTQHPILRMAPVDPAPLPGVAAGIPGLRLMVLNGPDRRAAELRKKLASAGASFDISTVEGMAGVAALAGQVGPDRVVFGSLFPFFTWESARLKVREAGFTPAQERAVLGENARRLLR